MRARLLTFSIPLLSGALLLGCQEQPLTPTAPDDVEINFSHKPNHGGGGGGGADPVAGDLTVNAGAAFVTTTPGEFTISRDSNKKLDLRSTDARTLRATVAMAPVPADPAIPDPLVNGDCKCWDKDTDLPGDPALCNDLLDRLTLSNVDWVKVIVDRFRGGGELRVKDDGNTFQNPPGFSIIDPAILSRNNEPVEPLPASWPALVVTEAPSSPTPTLPRTVTYSGGILWNNSSGQPSSNTQLYCRNDHVVSVDLAALP